MTAESTTSRSRADGADAIVSGVCPVCRSKTRLHAESLGIGVDVLCSECSAILRVVGAHPLTLTEVEEDDLF